MENRTDANKDDLQKIKIQKLMYKIENKSTLICITRWVLENDKHITTLQITLEIKILEIILDCSLSPRFKYWPRCLVFNMFYSISRLLKNFSTVQFVENILIGHLQSVFVVKFYCPEMV